MSSKPANEPSGLRYPDAHADSPAGGGGTGFFAPPDRSRTHPGILGRGPLFAGPGASAAGAPATAKSANPPPKTAVGEYQIWKIEAGDITIDVTLTVLPDSTGTIEGDYAETSFEWETTYAGPSWTDDGKKVTAINARLEATVTATMQTQYPEGLKPRDPSEYGRGTTPTDIANGDTTLGFHEWCHHQAIHEFTKKNLLRDRIRLAGRLVTTDFPSLVGMKVADVKTFGPSLKRQLDAYFTDAKSATGDPVDEVGIKKKSVRKPRKSGK